MGGKSSKYHQINAAISRLTVENVGPTKKYHEMQARRYLRGSCTHISCREGVCSATHEESCLSTIWV